MIVFSALLFCCFSFALSAADPILRKSEGIRYEYVRDDDGVTHLQDSWVKLSDLVQKNRYNPTTDNQYHLFTRLNPTVSQPLVLGLPAILTASNFDPSKKTVILFHGRRGHILAPSNVVVIPSILAGADMNVIGVDWSIGAILEQPSESLLDNVNRSGIAVAQFISWLMGVTGQRVEDIITMGFSIGSHQAGVVARNLGGEVSYVLAMDPPAYPDFVHALRADDAKYTEVINTDCIYRGLVPVGQVNFFPNGGFDMPGCDGNNDCNHDRAYFYAAESFATGGFTATECESVEHAMAGDCDLPGRLQMGGLEPKTGATGNYFLETNAFSPFSMG